MPKLATPLTDIAIRNYKAKAKSYKVADGKGLLLLRRDAWREHSWTIQKKGAVLDNA